MSILPQSFYKHPDVTYVAKALLGKVLYTNIDDMPTSGIIVETESYRYDEKACHAYNNKRTKRTETMFLQGGVAYVYLCYGMHHLFNVVTGPTNVAQAVLIRAIEPIQGQQHMLMRRKKSSIDRSLTAGPGALCQALGINKNLNGYNLFESKINILDHLTYASHQILCSKRVNIDYAQEDANLLWRFRVHNNKWTSLAK